MKTETQIINGISCQVPVGGYVEFDCPECDSIEETHPSFFMFRRSGTPQQGERREFVKCFGCDDNIHIDGITFCDSVTGEPVEIEDQYV